MAATRTECTNEGQESVLHGKDSVITSEIYEIRIVQYGNNYMIGGKVMNMYPSNYRGCSHARDEMRKKKSQRPPKTTPLQPHHPWTVLRGGAAQQHTAAQWGQVSRRQNSGHPKYCIKTNEAKWLQMTDPFSRQRGRPTSTNLNFLTVTKS
jgi:hypothetical protein